jgi:hypothetical protein
MRQGLSEFLCFDSPKSHLMAPSSRASGRSCRMLPPSYSQRRYALSAPPSSATCSHRHNASTCAKQQRAPPRSSWTGFVQLWLLVSSHRHGDTAAPAAQPPSSLTRCRWPLPSLCRTLPSPAACATTWACHRCRQVPRWWLVAAPSGRPPPHPADHAMVGNARAKCVPMRHHLLLGAWRRIAHRAGVATPVKPAIEGPHAGGADRQRLGGHRRFCRQSCRQQLPPAGSTYGRCGSLRKEHGEVPQNTVVAYRWLAAPLLFYPWNSKSAWAGRRCNFCELWPTPLPLPPLRQLGRMSLPPPLLREPFVSSA